jgi:hypothetical protein
MKTMGTLDMTNKLVYTNNSMRLENIEADELDGLYKLYKAECDRDKSQPDPKNFSIWLVEEGYIDD